MKDRTINDPARSISRILQQEHWLDDLILDFGIFFKSNEHNEIVMHRKKFMNLFNTLFFYKNE